MLQLAQLRNNPEAAKERLSIRYFKEVQLVDEIIALDDERKRLNFQFDETKAKINSASKEIGMLMGKGQKEEAEKKKGEVETFKNKLQPVQQALEEKEKALNDLLVLLPNLPSTIVPNGKTPEENEVVRTGGSKPELPAGCGAALGAGKKIQPD